MLVDKGLMYISDGQALVDKGLMYIAGLPGVGR